MNTIGTALRLTLFGSSHGPGVGGVLDGCPSGIAISEASIQSDLDLRKPSAGIGTARAETDRVEIQSGIKEGRTTGAPIQFFLRNEDKDSSKYETFRSMPRPGHADYPALVKYGEGHDIRGGGQFSGRMTAPIVAAGSVAKALLALKEVRVAAYSQSIGQVVDEEERDLVQATESRRYATRACDAIIADRMQAEIMKAKTEGDSVGGVVRCLAINLPVGVGEPFFDSLDGELAKMLFAIPAVKGVEFGAGFRAAKLKGSENNDPFRVKDGKVVTTTNHAGGILGGLSDGMPIDVKVAFKPTASISKEQRTVDLGKMKNAIIKVEGRHDPCIVPRAVIVVEAAVALVLADLSLRGGFLAR